MMLPKIRPGELPARLARQARKNARKAASDDVKREAKKRDGFHCRWPHCEYAHLTQPLDGAHVFQAAGMGGDPKLVRTQRCHVMALCRLHHKDAVESLHNANLRVEALTPELADGPCQFLRYSGEHGWYVVGMEVAVGHYARD